MANKPLEMTEKAWCVRGIDRRSSFRLGGRLYAQKSEIEGEMGSFLTSGSGADVASFEKSHRHYRQIKTTRVIFINQIRMQTLHVFFIIRKRPQPARIEILSSNRIRVRKAAQIKRGEEVIGNRVKSKIVKNKVAALSKRPNFDIIFCQRRNFLYRRYFELRKK